MWSARLRPGALALLSLLAALGIAGVAAYRHLAPESSPAARGAALARAHGCWGCHQQAERGEGARAGAPSLFDPEVPVRAISERIRRIPAHAFTLSASERGDLAAWIGLVRYEREQDAARRPRSELAAAEALARRHCFGCHGELGQGGVTNPGSLKGYVPGFFGRDFDVLTGGGDPALVRAWIGEGEPAHFREGLLGLHPGPWLRARAQVRMPAYDERLRRREVQALVHYLGVLRALGPLDVAGLEAYRSALSRRAPDGSPREAPSGAR